MNMKTKPFNSNTEISLRILLTLLCNERNTNLTTDRIAILDFVTIYSREFGISENNLHGDNYFSFTEYATRRKQINENIKQLVLKRMVKISTTDKGFTYSITDSGKKVAESLSSAYAHQYHHYAKLARGYVQNKSEADISRLIAEESVRALIRR